MLRKLLDGGIRCVSARAAESISKRARSTVRDDLARLHAGPLRSSQKTYRIEKIRFLKPDVAVVQASSHSINGDNIGTFVLEKQKAVCPRTQRSERYGTKQRSRTGPRRLRD